MKLKHPVSTLISAVTQFSWIRPALIALVFGVAILGATGCGKSGPEPGAGEPPGHEHSATMKYTCPMHPEVVQDAAGDCPKCGMKLVEKK